MMVIDSREKSIEHIERYFKEHNIEYHIEKLDTGDYMNTDNRDVIVDRKRSLDECAQNLYSADSSRFWRELRRAHESRIKLIFLVEHGNGINCFDDVIAWNSKYSAKVTGKQVANEMFKTHVAYGVDWLFCQRQNTAQRILELLKYDGRGE